MQNHYLFIILALTLVPTSKQSLENNEIEIEDAPNPIQEAASQIFKEQNLQNIGGILSNAMQNGAIQEGIGNLISQNSGAILEGLGSILSQATSGGEPPSTKKTNSASKKSQKTPQSEPNMGEMLGGLLTTLGGQGGGNPLLQGLGSMLQQGVDPSMITGMLGMFANQGSQDEKRANSEPDMLSLLSNVASLFGGAAGGGNSPGEGLASALPLIMQTVSSFMGPEAQKRSVEHAPHSKSVPPILETMHLYWDNFINSDMGRVAFNAIGGDKMMKHFIGEDGKFSYDKFVELMENHSFRRKWIQILTKKIEDVVGFASKPEMQKRYLSQIDGGINTGLQLAGLSNKVKFDQKKPKESLAKVANHILKKQFKLSVDSKDYIYPVVEYVEEIIALSQKGGSSYTKELSDKLADTINLEIIEPVAKVNRAFRYARNIPRCDRYVMCEINRENNEAANLPLIKKMLVKTASLAASWFLSPKTSMIEMYSIIFQEEDCKKYFNPKCTEYHDGELKVTTEHVHNEL